MRLNLIAALWVAAGVIVPVSVSQTQTAPEVVTRAGPGVTPPRVIYQREPEYSEEARRAHYQGICTLSLVVGADGVPGNIRMLNRIGMGLDEKAMEAVRTWRFEPATRDGKPVAMQIAVEVSFHLYDKPDKLAMLRRKADAGDVKAQLELALAYLEGKNAPKDDRLGVALLEKAARHGSSRAQFLMGERKAQEVPVADLASAYAWYTLARRSGDKHADKALRELSAKMTPEQLRAGQSLADEWTNTLSK